MIVLPSTSNSTPERLIEGGTDLDAEPFGFGAKFRELVGIAHVERHRRGEKLDRIVRLHVGGLIGDQRISGGVALVEAVFGESLEHFENRFGLRALDAALDRAGDEIARAAPAFPCGSSCPSRGATGRPRRACSRRDLRGLHHLFLIDDDAEGLAQDRLELGVDVVGLLLAMLARAIGRDVRHRPRPIERDQRDDVLETVRPHVEQRAPHARTFQLEHADRFARAPAVRRSSCRRAGSRRDRSRCRDGAPVRPRFAARSASSGRGSRISPGPPARPISC